MLICAAIAVALAEEGAEVELTRLDDEPAAERVAARIRQIGRRVHRIRVDVARLADIDMMVTDTARVLGAPNILVNADVYPRVKLLAMIVAAIAKVAAERYEDATIQKCQRATLILCSWVKPYAPRAKPCSNVDRKNAVVSGVTQPRTPPTLAGLYGLSCIRENRPSK